MYNVRVFVLFAELDLETEFLYTYMEDTFGQNGRRPVHIYGCKVLLFGTGD